jgi:hypothetical protein
MTTTTREQQNDKPLGDSGSGASGGGSGGNFPSGSAPATGGYPRQGVRKPDVPRSDSGKADSGEPEDRDLRRQPKQTAEVPLGSIDRPEASGSGGFGSHSTEPVRLQSTVSSPPDIVYRTRKPSNK